MSKTIDPERDKAAREALERARAAFPGHEFDDARARDKFVRVALESYDAEKAGR